jgi:hypothetical protein
MKKSDAFECVTALVAAWPTPDWPDETIELYANRIQPFDLDIGSAAIMSLVDDGGSYRPSIGQVRDRCLELQLGDLPSPNIAWAEVMEQMKEPYRPDDAGEKLDPHPPLFSHDLIAYAVATYPGSVQSIIAVADGKSTDWSIGTTFKDHYVEVCKRVKRDGSLPGGIMPRRRDVKAEIAAHQRTQVAPAPTPSMALTETIGPPTDAPDDGGEWEYDPDIDLNTGRVVGWYRKVPPTPAFLAMWEKLSEKTV